MANDDRDILELLKEELDFIEQGRIRSFGPHSVEAKVSLSRTP